jgi:hypothetical protein
MDLNSLSSFIWGVPSQFGGQESLMFFRAETVSVM